MMLKLKHATDYNRALELLQQAGIELIPEDLGPQSVAEYKAFLTDCTWHEGKKLLESAACPTEVLEFFIRDERKWMQKAILRNPKCPIQYVKEAEQSTDRQGILAAVAENPQCSRSRLAELLALHDEAITASLVKNPQITDIEISEIWERWTSEERRMPKPILAILKHRPCSQEMKDYAFKSRWATGLRSLAKNKYLTERDAILICKAGMQYEHILRANESIPKHIFQ